VTANSTTTTKIRCTQLDYIARTRDGSLYWNLLSEISWKRWALLFASAIALFFLYFFGLTRAGLIGPDEPRYAAIGAAMAQSGDWVTPRLWGVPWFEKPALLYWMTAAAFKAGLGEDLAPRLPVALLSVCFLIFFFLELRRQFGERTASYATAILATSAWWLAFSHSAVPDLPMSATYAAAMLLAMRLAFPDDHSGAKIAIAAGVLLGLSVLAKGLGPLALFLPAVWFLRRKLRYLILLLAVTVIIATPWYALIIARQGQPFIDEFLWKQTLGRLASHALAHERPFWFYLPVLIGGLFPWSPLLAILLDKRVYKDQRTIFLLVWSAWVIIFFSIFLNKLPGYVLPLFPAVAVLLAIALTQLEQKNSKMMWLLSACGLLLYFVPVIQNVLPRALQSGLSRATIQLPYVWIVPALALGFYCAWLEREGHREGSIALIAAVCVLSVVSLIWKVYPLMDMTVSARGLWKATMPPITCVTESNRTWLYGLNYYAGTNLPDCK
jgi:4-amino-4-deoxy-L-arabinose transferase-like glycosyltransferase